METPLYLLLIAAPIGALDVVYFHIWKFRLYARPQSRGEEVAHLMRGLIVPVIVAILVAGRPEGAWFWFVVALFAADSVNSVIDVMLEPASRAPIGVPPAELAVHFIGTTVTGAAWATFMTAGWATRNAPAMLRAHDFLPPPYTLGAWGAVGGAFALLATEAVLFLRARSRTGAGLPSSEAGIDQPLVRS
jgi:hypothetical protein